MKSEKFATAIVFPLLQHCFQAFEGRSQQSCLHLDAIGRFESARAQLGIQVTDVMDIHQRTAVANCLFDDFLVTLHRKDRKNHRNQQEKQRNYFQSERIRHQFRPVRQKASAYGAFERYAEQFLGLDGELHGEFLQHLLGIAVDDKPHGLLGRDAPLIAIEELVF